MNNTERILRYISDELDTEEKKLFEKDLVKDDILKKEYHSVLHIWQLARDSLKIDDSELHANREELIRAVLAAHDVAIYQSDSLSIKESALREKLETLMTVNSDLKTEGLPKRSKKIYRLTAIIISMAASLFFILLPGPDSYELASIYYHPENDPELDRETAFCRSSSMNGIYAFKQGNYHEAKSIFESQHPQNSDTERFYYALACYETGDNDLSISTLGTLLSSQDSSLVYTTQWYLSLIHLKTGNNIQAEKILKELASGKGFYRQKSRKLLRRMD